MRMRYLYSTVLIVFAVYITGIFLEASPVARVVDPVVGMSVPQEGSSVWRFTEGCSITKFKEHGLNAALPAGRANVYLHGDSYIEALMVPDEKKPDAVLTHALGGTNLVWGIGRSGTGIPSFIVHAREYERTFGIPRLHIFFVTSTDDIIGDIGDEFVWDEEGVRKCPPRTSPAQMRLARIVNRYHINFILSAYNKIKMLKSKRWRLLPGFGAGKSVVPMKRHQGEGQGCKEKFGFLCAEIKRTIRAPVLFVYCPNAPVLENGAVSFPVGDEIFCGMESVDILDVSPALNKLYETKGVLPHGYDNAGGPGRGHLNADGIEAVFSYVSEYLKREYAL